MYVCDICRYKVKNRTTYENHRKSVKHINKSLENIKLMELELKEAKDRISELLKSLEGSENRIKERDNIIKEKNDIIREKNDIIKKIEIIRDNRIKKKICGFGCIKAEF